MRNRHVRTIGDLKKTFSRWLDVRYPLPLVFDRYAKGLSNVASFVATTLAAYDSYSQKNMAHVSRINKKLEKEGKTDTAFGTMAPIIIADYFVPRLFNLSYLGAWGLFENYLRDVLWLALTGTVTASKSREAFAGHIIKTSIDKQKIFTHIMSSRMLNIHELARLYKQLLGIDVAKNKDYKALVENKKIRNKLAHTGEVLGYTGIIEEYERYQKADHVRSTIPVEATDNPINEKKMVTPMTVKIDFSKLGKVDRAALTRNRELEEALCSALIHMWRLGDFVRRKIFLTRSRQ